MLAALKEEVEVYLFVPGSKLITIQCINQCIKASVCVFFEKNLDLIK